MDESFSQLTLFRLVLNSIMTEKSLALGFLNSEMFCSVKLGWLPISYNRDFNLSKIAYKAMQSEDWPSYLRLEVRAPQRLLQSSNEVNLLVLPTSGTLQDCAAKLFNNLPRDVKH